MKITARAANIAPSLTLEITAQAKKLKSEGKDVVSFGAGEPDFNTPEYIRNAAKASMDKGLIKYTPASGLATLKDVICAKLEKDNGLSYKPADIVVSNGAKHSLHNAMQAIVSDGDEVIIPAPYWLTYPELVKLAGGVPVFVYTKKENGYKITAQELENAITDKTRAIILNNPNNPTGSVYSKEEIIALAKVLEKTDVAVISDEIYEMLNYTGEKIYSIAQYSEKMKNNTIIVNGVSKSYAMTGWRIGFTACDTAVAKAMSSMQSHMTSNPNTIAQYATISAYTDEAGVEFIEQMHASFDRRRKLICAELDKIDGLSYVKPEGAFYVFVDVTKVLGKKYEGEVIDTPLAFAKKLLSACDVAVIPCESFGNDECIRLSYAVSDEDIVKGVGRIASFVAKMN